MNKKHKYKEGDYVKVESLLGVPKYLKIIKVLKDASGWDYETIDYPGKQKNKWVISDENSKKMTKAEIILYT